MATVILIGVAVITACTININPSSGANHAPATPVHNAAPIIDHETAPEITEQPRKTTTDATATRDADADVVVPSGYTALAYLQTSGTQYIDTGVLPGDKTRVIMDWKYNSTKLQQRIFSTSPNNSIFGFEVYLNGISNYACSFGGTMWYNTGVPTDQARHVIDLNACENTLKIDNGALVNAKITTNASNLGTLSLYLFAAHYENNGSTATDYGIGNAYSCKIYDNGVLQRNFVPVRRDSDGKLGMYDLVTDQLYTNAGTGEFVAGEKQITLQDKNHLYIATNIPANGTTPATAQGFLNYLNTLSNDAQLTCTGTVRCYDTATKSWYNTAVLYLTKGDSNTFCYYYYRKDNVLAKVVSTIGYLTVNAG